MNDRKNRSIRASLAIGVVAAGACVLAASGCSSTVTGTAEIQGAMQASSFPGAPSAIEVRDETGAVTNPKVESNGSFRFFAQVGHTYSLQVVLPSGTEPIVFPRKGGKLAKTFTVNGLSQANLGLVTHYATIPAGGFDATDGTNEQQCGHQDEGDGDGECEDGIDANTGLTCADGDHQDGADEQDGDNNDGEFDDDASDDGGPMAVPEHGLPDQLGCASDDEEDDGDDEEQDD